MDVEGGLEEDEAGIDDDTRDEIVDAEESDSVDVALGEDETREEVVAGRSVVDSALVLDVEDILVVAEVVTDADEKKCYTLVARLCC